MSCKSHAIRQALTLLEYYNEDEDTDERELIFVRNILSKAYKELNFLEETTKGSILEYPILEVGDCEEGVD